MTAETQKNMDKQSNEHIKKFKKTKGAEYIAAVKKRKSGMFLYVLTYLCDESACHFSRAINPYYTYFSVLLNYCKICMYHCAMCMQ